MPYSVPSLICFFKPRFVALSYQIGGTYSAHATPLVSPPPLYRVVLICPAHNSHISLLVCKVGTRYDEHVSSAG